MTAGPTSAAPTVTAVLRACPLAPLEARVLLAHALGWRRTELITRGGESLDPNALAAFRMLEARRVAGEPIAQIVGVREFYGLEFDVTPDVLIPRPETELLVETALAAIESIPRPRVLDLGTGSGAIAVAIASARPDARVWAVDRSGAALAVAARNAAKLLDPGRPGGPIAWMAGDWYGALDGASPASPALQFDIIVTNPPYIASGDPHLDEGDLRFEPRGALTDESDGLTAIRSIVLGSGPFLAIGASLWIEHGYDQAASVRALLMAAGFADVRSLQDLAGIERTTGGRRV
ncbi:peptide chain release factor N(5)-glutamine methyltransferase [Trinickia dabaoshanensis]|uniref:Release factor glutamine methyltransferase n=1 Tax=Trinickia dabaoshanensis TaxID=564714 RepID=A0A2N7VUR7_9BURK|nr:peptide chain release factor N(5)-glutamine methyltransferase [Trinickia dabaoshanensis]PMS20869.1 peptide chain release factor N(5)-glutamine methyltransferase [Trinickia dabaoshanensis]